MAERKIAYCKIHAAIGIGRVGNSPDSYFIGPEVPGFWATPVGGYVAAIHEASLQHRGANYSLERRWPQSPSWQRRHSAPHPQAEGHAT